MAIPELTKILNMDADQSFTEEISAEIWESLGEKIGFHNDEINRTIPTATQGVGQPGTVKEVGRKTRSRAAVWLVIGTAAVAATLFIGAPILQSGGLLSLAETPPPLSESISTPYPAEYGVPNLTVEFPALSYPAGEAPSPEQIIKDAGALGTDEYGNIVDVRVMGYEMIDFSLEGKYPLQLEIGENDLKVSVVITIEVT